MSRRRVIVVGAGPGGLTAAARLRERGGERVDVSLVAPGACATFLAGTLDVLAGGAAPETFSVPVRLDRVSVTPAAATEVSADGVVVDGRRLAADAVIAAPGLALGEIPAGLRGRAVAAWSPQGAGIARAQLPEITTGSLLIAACSAPYRCPPAPFALAVRLAEQHFRARHMVRVTVATPEPVPLAGVGGDAPSLVMDACAGARVRVEPGFAVDLEASADGSLRARDGRVLNYDAALLIPPHVRSPCLAGLPGEGPLVAVGERGAVDGTRLYVVGDAAGTGLPRAAGVATASAAAAADGALEALDIAPAPAAPRVEAACFMFHYGGAVSRIRVAYDPEGAHVEIDGPSLDLPPAREGERRRFMRLAGWRDTPGA